MEKMYEKSQKPQSLPVPLPTSGGTGKLGGEPSLEYPSKLKAALQAKVNSPRPKTDFWFPPVCR